MNCRAVSAHLLGSAGQFARQKGVQGGEAEEELLAGDRNHAPDVFEAERPGCERAEAQAGSVADFPVGGGQRTQRNLEACIKIFSPSPGSILRL